MSSYWDCKRSSSNCVHFIYGRDVDQVDDSILIDFKGLGIEFGYVDCSRIDINECEIANAIAGSLKLPNAPYEFPAPGSVSIWVRFLDDLITISEQRQGILSILDSADELFEVNAKVAFRLIEAFLTPLHHWLDKRKPYHLCFQVERSARVRELFGN